MWRVGARVEALVELPTATDAGTETAPVLFLDDVTGEISVGADVGQDREAVGVVEKKAADDFAQDAVCDAGNACVVEENAPRFGTVLELLVGEPVDQGILADAGGGFDDLETGASEKNASQ